MCQKGEHAGRYISNCVQSQISNYTVFIEYVQQGYMQILFLMLIVIDFR